MSKTYKPKKVKRLKKHGFIKRSSTRAGKNTMKRRRQKGRKRIAL